MTRSTVDAAILGAYLAVRREATPTPIRCSAESHADLRADVGVFRAGTTNPRRWGSLEVAECVSCQSTLCLYICADCGEACPSIDCLPVGDGDDALHFACAAKRALARGRTKYVIVAGGGKAVEFVRS